MKDSPHSVSNRIMRVLWHLVWVFLFRTSPRPCFGWRSALLRLFGATVGRDVHVYPSCRIWAPWNLVLGDHACLADSVDCYCVDRITLEEYAVVSQEVMLCTATHAFQEKGFPLVTRAITIQAHAWIAARSFVMPGITVARGAIVGAASVVTKDVAELTVVAGNPAKSIGMRDPDAINFD